jgi:hypothetical protein
LKELSLFVNGQLNRSITALRASTPFETFRPTLLGISGPGDASRGLPGRRLERRKQLSHSIFNDFFNDPSEVFTGAFESGVDESDTAGLHANRAQSAKP